jgi:hypothetical protein
MGNYGFKVTVLIEGVTGWTWQEKIWAIDFTGIGLILS